MHAWACARHLPLGNLDSACDSQFEIMTQQNANGPMKKLWHQVFSPLPSRISIRDALREFWTRLAHSGCASRILDARSAFASLSRRLTGLDSLGQWPRSAWPARTEPNLPIRNGEGGGHDPSDKCQKFYLNSPSYRLTVRVSLIY